MTHQFHPAYFETHFRGVDIDSTIRDFAIITAYATTGEEWTDKRNEEADRKLQERLQDNNWLIGRMIGYSPSTGHAEPGWAVAIGFEDACDIGAEFKQDAIYYVKGDTLSVSFCDKVKRGMVEVGEFRSRFTVPDWLQNNVPWELLTDEPNAEDEING